MTRIALVVVVVLTLLSAPLRAEETGFFKKWFGAKGSTAAQTRDTTGGTQGNRLSADQLDALRWESEKIFISAREGLKKFPGRIPRYDVCGTSAPVAITAEIEGTGYFPVLISEGKICKFSQDALLVPLAHEAAFNNNSTYLGLFPVGETAEHPPRKVWYNQYPTNAGGVYSQIEECRGYMLGNEFDIILISQTTNLCNLMLHAMESGIKVSVRGYSYHTCVTGDDGLPYHSFRPISISDANDSRPYVVVDVRQITVE